jgi:hypothetical protein
MINTHTHTHTHKQNKTNKQTNKQFLCFFSFKERRKREEGKEMQTVDEIHITTLKIYNNKTEETYD